MSRPLVKLAAEGDLDLAVLRRIAEEAGLDVSEEFGRRGKNHLDRRIGGYNVAARFEPWIVLRDLDEDQPCAGALAAKLLAEPAAFMCFRIAVRAVESWLVADWKPFATEFGIRRRISALPADDMHDPKQTVLEALWASKDREIREAMVRINTGGAHAIGPEYNVRLGAYAARSWRPAIAANRSPSLRSARRRVEELAKRVGRTWGKS
jgi:hypothetical protein